MAHMILYAAGAAIVGGVGYAIYRHFRSPCPTKREMATILGDIDAGAIGRVEANAMVAKFDQQGCANEAAAVRKLLAAKDSRGAIGGLTVAAKAEWPDTDAVCKAAIDALPHDRESSPSGLVSTASYYELARDAAATAQKSGDPRALYNIADILEAKASEAAKVDMFGASAKAFSAAAKCLRARGDVVSKMIRLTGVAGASRASSVRGIGAMRPMWMRGRWRWSRA